MRSYCVGQCWNLAHTLPVSYTGLMHLSVGLWHEARESPRHAPLLQAVLMS
jgi:hypothetical protein